MYLLHVPSSDAGVMNGVTLMARRGSRALSLSASHVSEAKRCRTGQAPEAHVCAPDPSNHNIYHQNYPKMLEVLGTPTFNRFPYASSSDAGVLNGVTSMARGGSRALSLSASHVSEANVLALVKHPKITFAHLLRRCWREWIVVVILGAIIGAINLGVTVKEGYITEVRAPFFVSVCICLQHNAL